MTSTDKWLDRAGEYLSYRNLLVREGISPDAREINTYEERASNCLSRAKRA